MEEFEEQFACEMCGHVFNIEEEREPGICGDCQYEQDSFNQSEGKGI